MNETIAQINPTLVWKNFALICSVPHPSKKEEQITKLVSDFGKRLNLETLVDEVGNVIIRKAATPGYENKKMVTLQGHLDMVPKKTEYSSHNFDTDPIDAYIDGDFVTAKETTLGADNGIGVAIGMGVLESKDIEHGPIECLFTVDEEVGMTGALELKTDALKGDILISLDGGGDGNIIIGNAGGQTTKIRYQIERLPSPENAVAFNVEINGLMGGHSGGSIHKGHANAIKLMTRILWHLSKKYTIDINSLNSGSVGNAIPDQANSIIVIPNNEKANFSNDFNKFATIIKEENEVIEKELGCIIKAVDLPDTIIESDYAKKLLGALYTCPNGVSNMSTFIEGLVETSSNLAAIHTGDTLVEILTTQRSALKTAIDDISERIKINFEMIGAETVFSNRYPSWQPNLNSKIQDIFCEIYQKMYNQEMTKRAIHGGLEVGIIGDKYPHMDLVAAGPSTDFVHAPEERVSITSVDSFWKYLCEVLKNI